ATGGAAERFGEPLDDVEARPVAADELVETRALVDAAGDVAVEFREAPAARRPEGIVARERDGQPPAFALDHAAEGRGEAVEGEQRGVGQDEIDRPLQEPGEAFGEGRELVELATGSRPARPARRDGRR